MKAILIGSRAIKYHYSDFRQPRDWDIIADSEWVKQHQPKPHVEVKEAVNTSDIQLLNNATIRIASYIGDIYIPPKEDLITLKRVHLYWPLRWPKHIADYHFLKSKNLTLNEELYKNRLKEHELRLGKSKVKLDMSNEEFFDKSETFIGRIYKHDDLHRVTCYFDKPLYLSCKKDINKAILSKELFDKLPFNKQLCLAREECYALSLERSIIPAIESNKVYNINIAYNVTLMKLSTTMTKGWFREFLIENWPKINAPDKDYVEEFLKAIENKKITRIS